MVAPLIIGAMYLASALEKRKAAEAKAVQNAIQYGDQQAYAAKQTNVNDSILSVLQQLKNQQGGFSDSSGSSAIIDPATGQWKFTLGAKPQAIQNASYDEELKRDTIDAGIRRTGLLDAERMRQQASGESDTALRDLNNFRAGVGKVDPTSLAGALKVNRTGVVNAGYDDAARAASRIGLRTGTSAGDALSTIARNRSHDIATQLGDPDAEALQLAEGMNTNRQSNLTSSYNLFNTKGSNVLDSGFNPASYATDNTSLGMNAQKLDSDRYDNIFGALGAAGAGYGATANGMRLASGLGTASVGETDKANAELLQGLANLFSAKKSGS